MMDQKSAVTQLIQRDFDLAVSDSFSEEEILRVLARRIELLLSRNPEDLFQLMYRLDISEVKLANAFTPEAMAQLVWDRQLEKIKSRADFPPDLSGEQELKW